MNIATIKVDQICACPTERKPVTSGMAGVTVTFEYDDPLWDGLNKTAVFVAGSVTRDVLNADSVVTIPAEVLKKPGLTLVVGIYGTNADGKLIIPTLMTPIGMIIPGADPSGDPGADPDLPIWAQLQAEVEALKHGGTCGGVSTNYNEENGELTIAGSSVTYNEYTGELVI